MGELGLRRGPFDPRLISGEPPNMAMQIHLLIASHFALDEEAPLIAERMRRFLG